MKREVQGELEYMSGFGEWSWGVLDRGEGAIKKEGELL